MCSLTPHLLRKFLESPCGHPAGYLGITCMKIIGERPVAVNETAGEGGTYAESAPVF